MAVAKFQLSELVIGHIALVDRPAVPGAAFTMIKSADAANEALVLRIAQGWLQDLKGVSRDIADIRASRMALLHTLARLPVRHRNVVDRPQEWARRARL